VNDHACLPDLIMKFGSVRQRPMPCHSSPSDPAGWSAAQDKTAQSAVIVYSSRINQYERGVHTPDYAMAQRLARALGVTTAFLFADDESVARILLAVSAMPASERRRLARQLDGSTDVDDLTASRRPSRRQD
jgi:hypothetical protein